jgi:heat shock protein HslJ
MPLARRVAAFLIPVAAAAVLSACGSGISLDEPIEGPVWRLVQLGDQPVPPGREPQRDAQLQFDRASGRVSGSGGCNRLTGTFTRAGGQLRIGQVALTRMACLDAERGASEARFAQMLQTVAGYRLAGAAELTLIDAEGRTLATLQGTP